MWRIRGFFCRNELFAYKHLKFSGAMMSDVMLNVTYPKRRQGWCKSFSITQRTGKASYYYLAISRTIALRNLVNIRFPDFGTTHKNVKRRLKSEHAPLSYRGVT